MITRPPPEAVLDLDRYPVHDPESVGHASLLAACREKLEDDGCVTLPGFVRPDALAEMAATADSLIPTVHHSKVPHSIYGGEPDDEAWPEGHPRRYLAYRTGGFVCADLIPERSAMWAVYLWDGFTAFLSKAFGHAPLYRYADPISCMAVNVMGPGNQFPWHFDSNEYTVTLMLRPPEAGGVFEYIPFIRTPENERYEAVAAALAGDRDGVKQLPLAPGDVQLFKGRYTLHRVTAVEGETTRMVATPAYSTKPGMVGPLHRMLRSYGRARPIHYERAGLSPDGHPQ
jgi:hypothetical protein